MGFAVYVCVSEWISGCVYVSVWVSALVFVFRYGFGRLCLCFKVDFGLCLCFGMGFGVCVCVSVWILGWVSGFVCISGLCFGRWFRPLSAFRAGFLLVVLNLLVSIWVAHISTLFSGFSDLGFAHISARFF